MSYPPKKQSSKDLFIDAKAADTEPPPVDSHGARCRKYRHQMRRLLHLMSKSGIALLQHEGEQMRQLWPAPRCEANPSRLFHKQELL